MKANVKKSIVDLQFYIAGNTLNRHSRSCDQDDYAQHELLLTRQNPHGIALPASLIHPDSFAFLLLPLCPGHSNINFISTIANS